MTHFIGAVLVPEGIEDVDAYLTSALAPFDENREMPRYVAQTKQQVIEAGRKSIQEYAEGRYAEYLADPGAYAAVCTSPGHLNYLAAEFPKRLAWTDEEVYADAVRYEEAEDIGPEGEVYSTRNPEGYWDWWTVGGRWESEYAGRQGEPSTGLLDECARTLKVLADGGSTRPEPTTPGPLDDAERKVHWWFPRNIVVPDGEGWRWVKQGHVGWFGITSNDASESEWIESLKSTIEAHPETRVYYVDFHI